MIKINYTEEPSDKQVEMMGEINKIVDKYNEPCFVFNKVDFSAIDQKLDISGLGYARITRSVASGIKPGNQRRRA